LQRGQDVLARADGAAAARQARPAIDLGLQIGERRGGIGRRRGRMLGAAAASQTIAAGRGRRERHQAGSRGCLRRCAAVPAPGGEPFLQRQHVRFVLAWAPNGAREARRAPESVVIIGTP
jgi:hypothetical protein